MNRDASDLPSITQRCKHALELDELSQIRGAGDILLLGLDLQAVTMGRVRGGEEGGFLP